MIALDRTAARLPAPPIGRRYGGDKGVDPDMKRFRRISVMAAVLFGLAGIGNTGVMNNAAYAQNSDLRDLVQRVNRVQRELSTLQSHIYKGKPPPPPPPGSAAANPKLAAAMGVRLNQLESEIGKLTGKVEEVSHKVGQLAKRVEKLVGDVDFRLGEIEKKVAAAPPAVAAGGQTAAKTPAAAAPGAPRMLGRLPASALQNRPKPGAAPAPKTPAAAATEALTPKQQYDKALDLLRDRKYSDAERSFRAFIDGNADHKLLPNAHYWLGEAYFVRKDYQRAAFTFAEGFQKFPDGNKAPDNLLKLGMSLGKLGNQKEACTAFSRLIENYPKARKAVKNRVARQQRSFNCS